VLDLHPFSAVSKTVTLSTMNFYWLYELPNWLFFTLIVGFFVFFSIAGTLFLGRRLENYFGLSAETNDIVATFLSLSGVFYGITLGLIAVSTFETFNEAEASVNNEANSLNTLYRAINLFERPEKKQMRVTLKKYAIYMVKDGWNLQRQGIVPTGLSSIVDTFQKQLINYELFTDKDKIVFEEVLKEFNILSERRRQRVSCVTSGLPSTIWVILLLGAFVNIALTWLLVIGNRRFDLLINTLSGILLGALIFWIAAMDNPFRGEYSVSSEAFELLLKGVMK
jgi:hypothetical protein